MKKKSDLLSAYVAGREAVEGSRIRLYTGLVLVMLIGPSFEAWLTSRYALPWFARFPVYAVVLVLLAEVTVFLEEPVKRVVNFLRGRIPS
jgi:hypothetical protein